MALCPKDVEWIQIATNQAQRRSKSVEIDCLALRWVYTAEINHKTPIDEYPNIIVSSESQDVWSTRVIVYGSCDLHGKMVIVRVPLISKQLVVNREER